MRFQLIDVKAVARLLDEINGNVLHPVHTTDFATHLHHELELSGITVKRNEILGVIQKTADAIEKLGAENAALAESRRNGIMANTDIMGQVGLNLLDIDVLNGILAKAEGQLSELPDNQRDWHGESWDKSVKDSRVKALFGVIEACEAVITDVLRDLRATNDVTPNYSRTVKVPWN